ncbi:MAG: S-layer protein [Cyanobacteria bacterium QS_8_64_29]|nr:MAG: S-layer protein [Cyanobacteria bacterium QS_8_64_29]
MKASLSWRLATLATAACSALALAGSARAVSAPFGSKQVDQNNFIAVAEPYGPNNDRYSLLVIEQKSNERQCWETQGSASNPPVKVEPLLLNFDFSGICGRATDSNGYSIRRNGIDLGQDYLIRIEKKNGELQLIGEPRDSQNPTLQIGSTRGLGDGFLKIFLNDGWRFAKRTYQGKTLGHVYLAQGKPAFPDIESDIYRAEIQQAVDMGFISGFPNGEFRPEANLTREQIVSIALEAAKGIPQTAVDVPANVSSAPYPDVEPSRWSAAKIQWAKDNGIVEGYPNGEFRPQDPVTRAELMAIERKLARYAQSQRQQGTELAATQEPTQFSDTSDHWANELIAQMSAYCGVVSPRGEEGDAFAPDRPAQRNYAATATLRVVNCLQRDGAAQTEGEASSETTGNAQ